MRTCNYLTLILLFLTSCATITHQKQYAVYMHSNQENSKVVFGDSIYDLPDSITIRRSKNGLNLTLLGDSISREYTIKSSPNREFLHYNLFWVFAAPIAYAIDFTTPKRFYYGDDIFFNVNDTTSLIIPGFRKEFNDYFYKPYPTVKNQINLFLSIPYINSFRMHPADEPLKINTGFWGISAGLEFFYRQNRFLSFNVSGVSDLFVPFPVSPGFEYPYEMMKSWYISLTDNIKYNRFNFGFGICYANNIWEFSDYRILNDDIFEYYEIIKIHRTLGAVFNGYHRIWEDFFIGFTYRPTFIKIQNPREISYEHLISFSIGMKIRLKK